MINKLLKISFFIILLISFILPNISIGESHDIVFASCISPGNGNEKSPYYNKDSNSWGLHPTLSEAADKLIKESKDKLKIDVRITQGFRSVAYQDYLYSQGRTCGGSIVTNAKGSSGSSYHQYGLAFDIYIEGSNWDIKKDMNGNGKGDWIEVGELAETYGLEWGGSWTGFVDNPHFQYTFGLTTAELKAGKTPPEGSSIIPGGGSSTDENGKSDIINPIFYTELDIFETKDLDVTDIGNVGVNDKKNYDNLYQSYKLSNSTKRLLGIFHTVSLSLGILIFGYISLIWLLIVLARNNIYPLHDLLNKITFGVVDAHEDLGQVIKSTIIIMFIVVIAISGLMPFIFGFIYGLLMKVLEFIS